MNRTKLQYRLNFLTKPYVLLALAALIIGLLVFFIPPYPGVSDQGDFERILQSGGLTRAQEAIYAGNHNFVYTQFGYGYFPFLQMMQIIPTSSLIYPIVLCWIPHFFGLGIFSTHLLAIVQLLFYCFAFSLFLRGLYKMKPMLSWILGIFGIFVLFDAGYLVWMNSLYQEAAMYTGFLLIFGVALNVFTSSRPLRIGGVIGFTLACAYFLLSKVQVLSTLPIILALFAILAWKYSSTRKVHRAIIACLCIVTVFSGSFYIGQRSTQGNATTYNSLFFGLLMDSPTPEADLAELGLAPELIQDIGKHAFLPEEEYYCPPNSDRAQEMIYDKVSTFTVVKFYLTHPDRLIKAMEYMGKNVFDTASSLGKYEQYQVSEYTMKIGRFTGYSDLRNRLPKNLYFLLGLFSVAVLYCILTLIKAKDKNIRALTWFLVAALCVCCVQFPLPIFGNGHADTMKQTFLFTYSYDVGILLWLGALLLQGRSLLLRLFRKTPLLSEDHSNTASN